MNRRQFIKAALSGVASLVALPLLPKLALSAPVVPKYVMNATKTAIGGTVSPEIVKDCAVDFNDHVLRVFGNAIAEAQNERIY